jgi:hypothetical protein
MNAVILASTTDNFVGLILALAVVAYLVIVLVFPEKF